MTREECIALLERYAEYDGMGIPNLAGCREAMKMAADLLSQPSLPSNLDEAAQGEITPIMAEYVADVFSRKEHLDNISYGYCMEIADAFRRYAERAKQEQPEVELEKFTEKITTFQGRYKHPVSTSIKGAMAFMARLFYQYPNVARQWYEQLPKATMD